MLNHKLLRNCFWCLTLLLSALATQGATTPLADLPLLSTNNVPPNVMFDLSVEWPTGSVAGYNDNGSTVAGRDCPGRDATDFIYDAYGQTTGQKRYMGICYYPSRTYLSYFDPDKCYRYDDSLHYFVPTGAAVGHVCSASSAGRFSGNYMNWATAHAIDGFRWAMTGGDRYIDTPSTTVIEKSIHTGQGGDFQFPIKKIQNAPSNGVDAGTSGVVPAVNPSTVTPYAWSAVYARVHSHFDAMAYGTTRRGRVVQFANNHNFLNNFQIPGGIRFIKIQNSFDNSRVGLAEVQVLQVSNGAWSPPCAADGGTCNFIGPGEVRYGNGGNWLPAAISQGAIACVASNFSTLPPPNGTNHCEYRTLNNIAVGKSATQSSTAGGGDAFHAVDGNTDGDYAHGSVTSTNGDNQPWWQVDLGGARNDIRAVVIWNRNDGGNGRALKYFYVFASGFDMSSTPIESLVGNSAVWLYQEDQIPGPGQASSEIVGQIPLSLAPGPNDFATTYLDMRIKVCDPSVGLEPNCRQYGGNYKPTGVMQDNADKIRFGVMSYLNVDEGVSMGGVLRSKFKFLGPNKITPNSPPAPNAVAEINTSGQLVADPEGMVAADIKSSGAINYVNKFGKLGIKQNMKTQDMVSELFLEGLRYVRAAPAATPLFLPSAPWVSSLYLSLHPGATVADAQSAARDGFPVFSNWTSSGVDDRPIQYSCQKTYFVGMGDTDTWCDSYGPGDVHNNNYQINPDTGRIGCDDSHYSPRWSDASGVTSDMDVAFLQDRLGTNEGLGNLSNIFAINNQSAATYDIAGYSYFANTHDLLPDDASKPWTVGKQNAKTYWVDVRETESFNGNPPPKNQYWLATKYGSFKSTNPDDLPPPSFDPVDNYYFTGDRPDTMNQSLRTIFNNILEKEGTAAPAGLSGNNFATSGGAFLVKYDTKDWSGDILGNSVTLATNGTLTSTLKWDFAALLDGQNFDTGRKILSFNSTTKAGVPFRAGGGLSSTQLSYLGATAAEQSSMINYLRGDRSNESTGKYRTRTHVLGDIVNSQPVYVGAPSDNLSEDFNAGYTNFAATRKTRKAMLYAGSNDGMLHGINADVSGGSAGGSEVFAYVPALVITGPDNPPTPALDGIASRANPAYTHHFLVDGQTRVRSVDFGHTGGPSFGSPDWHTLLVGGLGKGGRGYYALDVTDPAALTGSEAAFAGSIVKWEYTDNSGINGITDNGYSYGRPIIAKTRKDGWVVILTSGYDTPSGRGFIVVLNAKTGALIQRIYTTAGSVSSPAGLAQANGFVPDASDYTLDAVYAGDLLGNVWRFDMTAASGSYPQPVLLTTLKDASNNPQPITTEPNIGVSPDSLKRWVFVGTGRLLDDSDAGVFTPQTFYGFQDGVETHFAAGQIDGINNYPFDRSKMVPIAYSDLTTGSSAVTPTTQGWYLDLNGSGERMVFNSVVNAGVVTFVTQLPSVADACAPAVGSRVYALDFSDAKTHLLDVDNHLLPFYETKESLLKPELVADSNGKVQMLISTGDTKIKTGPQLTQPGSGTPVRLNWREILQ